MWIFQFLPSSNDGVLVTGAADCKIRVHDIAMQETTHVFSCHAGRVKRVATAPNIPFMFWSAAEDGTVMLVRIINFPYITHKMEFSTVI